MCNQYELFTEVEPFYSSVINAVSAAKESVSMMYLIYDHGVWTSRLNKLLKSKSEAGVQVRIMADFVGTLTDHPRNILRNFQMIEQLKAAGVQVILFNPSGPRLSFFDRLHIKICAVDQNVIFLGGSNIGDYYTNWQDTNLKMEGDLGRIGHEIFEIVAARSSQAEEISLNIELPTYSCSFPCGDARLLLTIPGVRKGIHHCLLDLIFNARSTIYLRYWYFLPDQEIQNALCCQLENGVKVNIMLSNRTRIPVIDVVNRLAIKKLAQAGAAVYRYTQRYMHSKVVWTEDGDILIGSANMESSGMNNNFELCLKLNNPEISMILSRHFVSDSINCYQVKPN